MANQKTKLKKRIKIENKEIRDRAIGHLGFNNQIMIWHKNSWKRRSFAVK